MGKGPQNKRKKGIIWLILFILGGFIFELYRIIKKQPEKGHTGRFAAFLRAERREIKEVCNGEEDFRHFALDSRSVFKEYFIPHPGNCHKPRILRPKSLTAILLLAVLLKAGVAGYLFLSYPQKALVSVEVTSRVLELVNQERTAAGLPALAVNPVLERSALAKAEDLVTHDYFAHEGLDGKKPWDWIDRGQYAYLFVGENLAMQFTSADTVHRALMDSPSHRKNIMSDKYTEVGISMVRGAINGQETNVLVQHFATRKAPAVQIAAADDTVAGVTQPAAVEQPLIEVAGESSEPSARPSEPAKPAAPAQSKPEAPAPTEPAALPPAPPALPSPAEMERYEEFERALMSSVSPDSPGLTEIAEAPDKLALADDSAMPGTGLPDQPAFDPAANPLNRVPVASALYAADDNLVMTQARVRLANYALLGIMALLALALALNIFIRWEVQHKHVIAQSVLAIIVVGGLAFFRFHVMETGLPEILLL